VSASEVTQAEIMVVADARAATDEAGRRLAATLAAASAERGRADWAVSGGSSAVGIYRALSSPPLRDAVPWPALHVWWADDRYVPRDHPLSNVKPFDDVLLDIAETEEGTAGVRTAVPIPFDHLHPYRAAEAIAEGRGEGRGADWCADMMAAELREAGPAIVDGWPVFDVLGLGMGPDGHVLSVFPGSPAFDSPALALAVPAPTHVEPHVARVTLNPAVVAAARTVLVVITGADKAATVADVLGPVEDVRRWPAQLARRAGATWILDEAAAARLPR
jgi:6-phosphogluconolactonase